MKIYVEILTLCNGKKYEIAMDDKSNVGQVKKDIQNEIQEFESYEIVKKDGEAADMHEKKFKSEKKNLSLGENLLLYNKETKSYVPDNENVRSAGIKSGQTLILI